MKVSTTTITQFIKLGMVVVIATSASMAAHAQYTLDQCQQMAQDNYPLIKRYDLINSTTNLTIENLGKNYLPQVSFGAQATLQSDVMEYPDAFKDILSAGGYDIVGLKHDQYKVGIDVSQVIYDGGNTSTAKNAARAEGEVNRLKNDVDIYELRDRVNNLYFGILLLNDRIKLNDSHRQLLADNHRKLQAMADGGTALQADADAVKAELLKAGQQRTELISSRNSYIKMLGIFIGTAIDSNLPTPSADIPADNSVMRPELQLFDAQKRYTQARMKQLDASIKPRLSAFAQGFYGYPGLDSFEAMFDHKWTLNGIIGLKLSWNISSLYTHRREKSKLAVAINEIDNARDVFLFNNDLKTTSSRSDIERYRSMLADDAEIVELRTSIRQSAEAKLENGIIDVNDLLREITEENNALTQRSTHEIEMLKSIYELRTNLNQ